MKEIEITNIAKTITLVDNVTEKTDYKLIVQSENNNPFKIQVDTEKYFDTYSPKYTTVSNGITNINFTVYPKENYEMRILHSEKEPLIVRYNLIKQDETAISEENNKKIHDQRKQQLTELANFSKELDTTQQHILNSDLKEIAELYQHKHFEEADTKLNTLYTLLTTNQLPDYLQSIIESEMEQSNETFQNEEKISSSQSSLFSTINIIIITLVLFFLGIYLLNKFMSQQNIIPSKNIFELN